jgi:hypothetical protein
MSDPVAPYTATMALKIAINNHRILKTGDASMIPRVKSVSVTATVPVTASSSLDTVSV